MNTTQMTALPYIDPDPPRGLGRLALRMLSTRFSCALERSLPFRWIVWRLTPRAAALFDNRLPSFLPFAAAVLETRDVRNGRPHRRMVVYFNDGESVVLVPSKGGMPTDPHWLENATAEPTVIFGGLPFRAEVVAEEDERARLVALGDTYYPPYVAYRAHAARHGREIPVLRLARWGEDAPRTPGLSARGR